MLGVVPSSKPQLVRALVVAVLAILAPVGCGDDLPSMTDGGADPGSGVPTDKLISDLTPSEVTQLCTFYNRAAGGEDAVYMCMDGDLRVGPVSQCISILGDPPAACTATVGEIEDCGRATGSDACNAVMHAGCLAFFQCASDD